jgi:hypothetical protein
LKQNIQDSHINLNPANQWETGMDKRSALKEL